MTTDPAHQRFIDDAALGAKVRELVWNGEPIAPLVRCKRLELEVGALKGDIAALTTERDSLLAQLREAAWAFGAGQRGISDSERPRYEAARKIAASYLDAEKPAPRFKAGQRVKFVSKVAAAYDGAVGTIVTVRPDGLFVVGFKNWMLDGCYAEDQLAPEGAQP